MVSSLLMEEVMRRNNEAVDQMAAEGRGDLSPAGVMLTECFRMAKECILSGTASGSTTSVCQGKFDADYDHIVQPSPKRFQQLQGEYYLDQESFFLYHRPLYFGSQIQTLIGEDDFASLFMPMTCSIVLFNMAVLYHIRAVGGDGRGGNIALLSKAEKLYSCVIRLASEIIQNRLEDPAVTDTPIQRLLFRLAVELGLVASNNNFQVCCDLGDHTQADAATRYLQSFAYYINPENLCVLQKDEWEEILANTIGLKLQKEFSERRRGAGFHSFIKTFAPAA